MKSKFTKLCALALATLMLSACGTKPASKEVAVESIVLTAEQDFVYIGQTLQVNATVLPADATDKTLTWSSSTYAATVDANGLVTGAQSGSTIIKAAAKNGVTATITLKVKTYKAVTDVSFAKETITIAQGGGFAYSDVTVTPTSATEPEVEYVSSNPNVATVDENGMITAGEITGNATITVKSVSNPAKTDNLVVNVEAATWDNYDNTINATEKYDFQDLQKASSYNLNAIPASGNVKCLVIPFEFTDYPFTTAIKEDLNNLFNGKPEDTRYWESISSFYNKSSYGTMNLSFEIADVYKSGLVAANITGSATSKSIELANLAFNNYKTTTKSKCTEFDSDKDGYVDAVYFVYSAKDYSKVPSLNNDLFWAFCYWKQGSAKPDVNNPDYNAFMWASYDFMYAQGESKVDGHTFIHESGHLFGANDYYNYNRASSQRPLGKIDMMDNNIGDHNSYTKMAYGWSNPIYVEGNAKITIKTSALNKDNFILINDRWNKTAFDEYILLELTTPDGNNELDATTNYSASLPKVYNVPGVKMYHVDARLAKFNNLGKLVYGTPETLPERSGWEIPAANSDFAERNDTPELFYEIGLIQSGKRATMLKNGAAGSNEDLFHTGDYFRMSDYNEFFYQEIPAFNAKDAQGNRYELGYEIYFESVTKDAATIVIQKVAK